MDDVETSGNWDMLRQQTILARFGELALKSESLEQILTEACRLVGEALGTDLAKVMELQEDGETLLVRAGVGWKPGVVGIVTVKAFDDSSEGHALKTGKPMISPNIDEETRFKYPSFLIDHGVKAVANVVIIGSQDKPAYGILQIDSREPRAFGDNDTAFLSSYANLIAAAVNRLHVLEEVHNGAAQIRASLNRQETALETGLLGFFEWDVPAATITADKHFARFCGLDPKAAANGVPLSALVELVHPDDRATIAANVEAVPSSCSDYTKEVRLVHTGGTVHWVHVRGRCTEREGNHPLRFTGTAVNITASKTAELALRQINEELEARVAERTRELTEANAKLQAEAVERERVEEALRQSHKMEAVGQLTGGIAHDFNNLLTGISGSLELIRARVAQGRIADLERYIDAGLTSANRAAALTHRLLAFSRRQTLDPKPTGVNRLVLGMEDLIRRTMGPGIQVVSQLAAEPWLTLCDPNQLESALLNLAINARDAMPVGGSLVIETTNAVVADRRSTLRAGDPLAVNAAPGEYVVVSVTDTGAGMTPGVLARAFDPFFTTKPTGQGTGLGLSMIYGFVQQSGGQVHIRSEEGRSTTVTIHLPRYLGTVMDGEAATIAAASLLLAPKASAAVLVVEDEPAVRMIITETLSDLGYAVLEAADGRAGLDALEASLVRIDLLLTDVGLPNGMNGRQLADAARVRRPLLKVLFVTGYAETTALRNGLLDQGMEVMTKPFVVEALAAKVHSMISN